MCSGYFRKNKALSLRSYSAALQCRSRVTAKASFSQTNHTRLCILTVIKIEDNNTGMMSRTLAHQILMKKKQKPRKTKNFFTSARKKYCIYRIKVACSIHVLGWVCRKIKISYAILQSNLDSSEHCAFFSSRDKEPTNTAEHTHTHTNTHTHTQLHAPLNTLPSHFFNYQAGENSGEGLSVWSSVSISSVNNTSLGQS